MTKVALIKPALFAKYAFEPPESQVVRLPSFLRRFAGEAGEDRLLKGTQRRADCERLLGRRGNAAVPRHDAGLKDQRCRAGQRRYREHRVVGGLGFAKIPQQPGPDGCTGNRSQPETQ